MPVAVKPFTITRVLNAPRELVFQVHSEPSHLEHWFGPKGSKSLGSKMDFRVGGKHHYGMEFAGAQIWGFQIFREIVRPARLVFEQSFSNPEGGLGRHPMAPQFPQTMLSTLTFEELGPRQTKLTVQWEPLGASDAEIEFFNGMHESMNQGWSGNFDVLDEYLGRFITVSRLIKAPLELVWKALSEEKHVNAWWGPEGWSNSDSSWQFKAGGTWKYIMNGPADMHFPNHITWLEIQPLKRLYYEHGDQQSVHFKGEIVLSEAEGGTRVVMSGIFGSKEARDITAKEHHAEVGAEQNMAKLEAYVQKLSV